MERNENRTAAHSVIAALMLAALMAFVPAVVGAQVGPQGGSGGITIGGGPAGGPAPGGRPANGSRPGGGGDSSNTGDDPDEVCPRTPGYWKNHTDVWPSDTLTFGGVTYDQPTLINFLRYGGPDMSLKLARSLTASMLNVLAGTDPSIQGIIDQADTFFVTVPPGSNPQGADFVTAEFLKDELDWYNNNGGCGTGGGGGSDPADHCVQAPNASDLASLPGGTVLTLPGIGDDFTFEVTGGSMLENEDGSGELTGVARSTTDPGLSFLVDLQLDGRTDSGTPVLELAAAAYADNGGPVDPDGWHYYTSVSGSLYGLAGLGGAELVIDTLGAALQVGTGADGRSLGLGASTTFDWTVVAQPDFGDSLPHGSGGLNIALHESCDDQVRYCLDEALRGQYGGNGNHAMAIPGIARDFVWETHGLWIENVDGTAEFNGVMHEINDPDKIFVVSVSLSGRTYDEPNGSPKKQLPSSAYAPNGPADTSEWYYYPTWSGTLVGAGTYAGAEVALSRSGPAFQVGIGANNKNVEFGTSAWFSYQTLNQPTTGTTFRNSGRGDFNLDMVCPDGETPDDPPDDPEPTECNAQEVVSYSPGPRTDGSAVAPERADPTKALGAPEGGDWLNFVSLGIGGELVLDMGARVMNVAGDTDVQVVETSFGDPDCASYPEMVRVYASQDGFTWTDLGTGCLDSEFELGSLEWARYFRLVDETDPSYTASGDGYDVDGLNAGVCLPDDGTPTPYLEATKVDTVLDADGAGDGFFGPGDILEYSILIENLGDGDALDVIFEDLIPTSTIIIPGSVTTTQGTVTSEDPVTVDLGTLAAGDSATVTFQVALQPGVPLDLDEIVNQGEVGGSNTDPEPTDDPDTPEDDDPTKTPVLIEGCYADQPVDVVFVLDLSGSMTFPFAGLGTRVAAAQAALLSLNAEVAARGDGSRVALVTFSGFQTVEQNLNEAVTIESDFTTDYAAVSGLIAGFDASSIQPTATTPTAMALEETLDLFLAGYDPTHKPAIVWITDGVPNIDSAGRGPVEYDLEEIQAIDLEDGMGGYLSWPEVSLLGNFNFSTDTFDGEVLANAMYFLEQQKVLLPDTRIFGIALQGDGVDLGTFNEDLVNYSAFISGGSAFSATNSEELDAAVNGINFDWECGDDVIPPTIPASIGDRIWHDENGDGVQDLDEEGINGVVVRLLNADDAILFATVTMGDGEYLFDNLPAGDYKIMVDNTTLGGLVIPTYDFDGLMVLDEADVTVAWAENQLGVDFGYMAEPIDPVDPSCAIEDFASGNLSNWAVAHMGDAFDGGAQVVNERLWLTGNGTELFRNDDNAVFAYQRIQDDYRVEIDVTGFPVDQGGLVRKAGVMTRSSTDPRAARVMVNFIPHLPDPQTTALQFEVRTADNGVAEALADLVTDVPLPVRIAIERVGSTFSVEYSTDAGTTWIVPTGALGGSANVAMPSISLVGVDVASYDSALLMTAEFDNRALCGDGEPPVVLPPVGDDCDPTTEYDVVYVLDRSGSMRNFFPGAGTRLGAGVQSLQALNADMAARGDGSRAALISFSGFHTPQENLDDSVVVHHGLTTDFTAIDSTLSGFSVDDIDIYAPGPTALALHGVLDTLLLEADPTHVPVVVFLTDGVPNVDILGQGPTEYPFDEINPIQLDDGFGGWLTSADVALLGGSNPGLGNNDGQVLADAMSELDQLALAFPGIEIYSVAIQSDPAFNEDFLGYASFVSEGANYSATSTDQMFTHMGVVNAALTCQ